MDAVLISMIIIILVHALFFSSSHTNMLWISLRCAIRYNMHAHFDLIMRCRTFVLFYIITYSYQTHNGASEILHKGTGKQRIVYRFFKRNEHDGGLVPPLKHSSTIERMKKTTITQFLAIIYARDTHKRVSAHFSCPKLCCMKGTYTIILFK